MAISGLGGDELFAGYNIFKRLYFLDKFSWLNNMPSYYKKWLEKIIQSRGVSVKTEKAKELLHLSHWDLAHTYPVMRRLYSDDSISRITTLPVLPADRAVEIINKIILGSSGNNSGSLSIISKAELSTYLLNTLLRDTDQMSMSHALEVRVPFLDHELVEYVLNVNNCIKYPHSPKQLLVESLHGLLPNKIVHRKKMGFSFPWDQWMRKELKSFCEFNLHSPSLYPIFNIEQVDSLWQSFLKGDPTVTWSRIWPIVVLSHWMEKNNVKTLTDY
jgi:asparagine synthase (glutamine-hydrolysing)